MARDFNPITDMPRVTWITLRTIKLRCGRNAQSLYLEYLDWANEKKTNQPWATNSWMAERMGVGIDWVKEARAKLIAEGFIETVPPKWDKVNQKFKKNYTKINKIVKKEKILSSLSLTGVVLPLVSAGVVLPLVEKQHYKYLKDIKEHNLKDIHKREKDSASGKTQLNNVDNTTGLKANLMPEISKLPHIEQVELDIKNIVLKLRDLALKKAKQYDQGLHGSEGSELVKTLTKKIKSLMKAGDNLENAEIANSNAIKKYYDYWIQDDDEGLRRKNFGLVKSLETQWKVLTS